MRIEAVEVVDEAKPREFRSIVQLPGGKQLAFFEAGSGRDVLLIHGAALTSHDMRASLFEPLAERFHTVAVDRPGHGLSTRPWLAGSLRESARIVADGISELGLSRPIVVGHSIGGALALQLALDRADLVGGVVAIGPIAFPEVRLEQALFGPRAGLRILGLGSASRFGLDRASLPLLWRSIFLPQAPTPRFEVEMAFGDVRSPGGMAAVAQSPLAAISRRRRARRC